MPRKVAAARAEVPTRVQLVDKPTPGPALARVRAFLTTGRLPSGWGAPTPAYVGRAPMSDEEARKVVLPMRPQVALRLLPGDLGVERAVGRYLEAQGERLVRAADPGSAGHWSGWRCAGMGCEELGAGSHNGRPAQPAEWSCGCQVWGDTATEYTRPAPGYLPEFSHYLPARVEPCEKHRWALEGRPEAERPAIREAVRA